MRKARRYPYAITSCWVVEFCVADLCYAGVEETALPNTLSLSLELPIATSLLQNFSEVMVTCAWLHFHFLNICCLSEKKPKHTLSGHVCNELWGFPLLSIAQVIHETKRTAQHTYLHHCVEGCAHGQGCLTNSQPTIHARAHAAESAGWDVRVLPFLGAATNPTARRDLKQGQREGSPERGGLQLQPWAKRSALWFPKMSSTFKNDSVRLGLFHLQTSFSRAAVVAPVI